jgi:heat shock protein HslJ
VRIERVEVIDGAIVITMLDRRAGEAFATPPSVRVTRRFTATNGGLVDAGPAVCDTSDLGGASFVFVTSPVSGARVSTGFTVEGCSRTFESTVNWTLFDRTGAELASGFTAGGGVDGGAPFAFEVAYALAEPSLGRLEVFEVDVSGGEGFPPPRAVVPLMLLTEGPALTDITWNLTSLAGDALVAGTAITARFEGSAVGGSSGCNSYAGSYTATGTSLTIDSPFTVTLAACEAAIMDQEQTYLAALDSAQSFAIDGTILTIVTEAGDLVFTSETVPLSAAQQLTGATWQLTALAGEALVAGTEITAQFDAGEVGGSSGCNLYGGSYTAEGTSIDFPTPFVSTEMACEASIMGQEQTYLAALTAAQSFTIDGETLTIVTGNGDLVFSSASS